MLGTDQERLRADVRRLFAGDAPLSGAPFDLYRALRTYAPVLRDEAQVVVTRYDDIAAIIKDPERFSSRTMDGSHVRTALERAPAADLPLLEDLVYLRRQQMVMNDAPEHRRLRATAHKAFTPRRVAQMRGSIQVLTDRLVDRVADAEVVDWMAVARQLPLLVVIEMFDFPAADHEFIREWGDTWARFWGTERSNLAATHRLTTSFNDYVREQIAERRRRPTTDLLAGLIEAEEEGGRLTEDELLVMVANTLFAGHETTINLLGNGMLCLVREPGQQRLLRDDPGLISSAVEEFLRFESPVHNVRRRVVDDCELHGEWLRTGDTLQLVVASANRDGDRFVYPDRLDVTRTDNRHLTFGAGVHFCLGAALARLEAEVVFGTILRRTKQLELAGAALDWQPNSLFRGLRALPLTVRWS
ncbi:cytochrome P450 [Actinophytocola sp.]|uniref:cytochrome P450 n=1 Tax=Actinophytocola sp. TaxID=1872138 RepID=UPI003D6B64F6